MVTLDSSIDNNIYLSWLFWFSSFNVSSICDPLRKPYQIPDYFMWPPYSSEIRNKSIAKKGLHKIILISCLGNVHKLELTQESIKRRMIEQGLYHHTIGWHFTYRKSCWCSNNVDKSHKIMFRRITQSMQYDFRYMPFKKIHGLPDNDGWGPRRRC